MTEREKMEKGLWYDANYDAELLEERLQAEDLCFAFNQTRPKESERKEEILKQLLPHKGEHVTILSPFYTDYGYNCRIGEETFLNHNAYLMDGAPITIGKHCFIGPNCGMYTANHPLVAEERNQGLEQARPITIGDNVWIGADVTILPGGHHRRGERHRREKRGDKGYSPKCHCLGKPLPRPARHHRGGSGSESR